MKRSIGWSAAFLVILCAGLLRAQLAIDTTKFGKPTPVPGDIPGLHRWANSSQSDSAVVTIISPQDGQRFKSGDSLFVTIAVAGVAVGAQTQYAELCGLANSAEGQHTHVILDNEPYLANYKSGQPFFVGIAKSGVHTLRVFASRSWHESIKSPGSFKTLTFHVDDTSKTCIIVDSAPLLTYSRPKGTYEGPYAKAVMVDFFLRDVALSPNGNKVRLTVDGKSTILTEWVPYIITDLSLGDHTFKLELVDKHEKSVPGPYNVTERTVTLK